MYGPLKKEQIMNVLQLYRQFNPQSEIEGKKECTNKYNWSKIQPEFEPSIISNNEILKFGPVKLILDQVPRL